MAGVLMKARSQIFRVSAIVSCLREALNKVPFTYTVISDDIWIAYSIIQVSLKIHEVLAEAMSASSTGESALKKSIGPLLTEEQIEESLLISGAFKIKRLYNLADESNEIKWHQFTRCKLWPQNMAGIDGSVFIQV